MHVVIFEGSHWHDFIPFSLTRPVFSMRTGTCTLLEKQIRYTTPTRVTLWVRPEMESFVRQYALPMIDVPVSINTPLDNEPALIFAARTLHFSKFEQPQSECVVMEEDGLIRLVYARLPGLTHDDVMNRTDKWMKVHDLPQTMPQTRFPRHWSDLVSWNEESLMCDSIYWTQPPPEAPRAHLVNPDDIHAEKGVSIGVNAVLDASGGPIMIAENASIGANSVIEGPVYIGPGSRISPLSLIRPGTTIGTICRVGGEVGNSIFQSYSNKSHEGFLGDSYIGTWVNMGAGTTTSNLKSTYGLVKLQLGNQKVQSDRVLLGSAIGDFSKTATHTQLTAGSYIGCYSMIAISNRLPQYIPSFQFWTDEGRNMLELSKAIEFSTRMCARRSRPFNEADILAMHYAAKEAARLGA